MKLHEILNILEANVEQYISDIFIVSPDLSELSDQDYGDKDEGGLVDNLNGPQCNDNLNFELMEKLYSVTVTTGMFDELPYFVSNNGFRKYICFRDPSCRIIVLIAHKKNQQLIFQKSDNNPILQTRKYNLLKICAH